MEKVAVKNLTRYDKTHTSERFREREKKDNGFRGPSKFFVTLRPPTPVPFPYERYDCSFFISPPGQVHKRCCPVVATLDAMHDY